ncbi:uncharacterized protein LOC142324933 isoform X2 [Lycorma delicatula]|uniref:uncharacterized protein LOC142324933 isoform X2 n=1 Tax=Lycorma delicatula TaxID=130591 RepID=UPI003F50D805
MMTIITEITGSNQNDDGGIRIMPSRIVSQIDITNVTSITADKLCRICGRYGEDNLTPIFCNIANDNRIIDVINKYLPITISENKEKLPNNICHLCMSHLIDWQCLIDKCKLTDIWLHKLFNIPYSTSNDELQEKEQQIEIINEPLKIDIKRFHRNSDFDHDYCAVSPPPPVRCITVSPPSDYKGINNEQYESDSESNHNHPVYDNFTVSASISEDIGEVDSDRIRRTYSKRQITVDSHENRNNEDSFSSSKKQKQEDSSAVKILQDISNKGKKYKIFSLSVCEKKDHCVKEEGVKKESTNKMDGSDIIIGDKSVVTENDNDSRDTLSPSPPVALYSDVDEVNSTSKINGDLAPPVPSTEVITSEKYIAKQRYKVGITLVKQINSSNKGNSHVENYVEGIENLDSINITISKPYYIGYKRSVKSNKYYKQAYGRYYIFNCTYCVLFKMTANEYGKHMKSFHPDKPLKCPICKFVFKEDYNLIIHLQVTSCGRPFSINEDVGDSVSDENHKTNLNEDNNQVIGIEKTQSDNLEFSVTVRLPHLNFSSNNNDYSNSVENGSVIQSESEGLDTSNNQQSTFHTENSSYEITIETWKPSTSYVTFEPGIVILDSLFCFSSDLRSILTSEIKKLLRMQILSLFDCNALKMMLDTKVSEFLKTAQDDKVITIKSVDSSAALEGKNDQVIEPFAKKLLIRQKSMKKAIKPLKKLGKVRPSLKELYSAGPRAKLIRRGRPVIECKQRMCNECGVKLKSSKDLWRHRKLNHIERKCSYCDSVFFSLKKLNKHEKEHKKDNLLRCEACSVKFDKKENLQKHNLLVHNIGEYVCCEVCDKKFVSKSSLHCHKRNVHGSQQHLCPYCGQMYKTLGALRSHLKDKHSDSSKNFHCPTCKKSFKNNSKLKIHMARHSSKKDVFCCAECHKPFFSKDSLKQHQEKHLTEPVAFCLICGSGFYRASRLPGHLRDVHWTTVNKEANEQFPCLVCNVMLEDNDSLAQHMLFHSEDDKVKEIVYGGDEGRFKCMDCEKFVQTKKDYALHKFFIHEEEPFKCYIDVCGCKFWSKAALDVHEMDVHNRHMHVCLRCNERFHTLKKKRIHMQKFHSDEISKSYDCKICNKSFRTAYTLDRHSVVHSNNKLYTCDRCGRLFSLPQILAKHLLWHKRQEGSCDASDDEEGVEYDGDVIDDEIRELEEEEDEEQQQEEEVELELVEGDCESEEVNKQQEEQSNLVIEEVLSVSTIFRCPGCNIVFKTKCQLATHFKESHLKHSEGGINYEPNEVLQLSMVESDMY